MTEAESKPANADPPRRARAPRRWRPLAFALALAMIASLGLRAVGERQRLLREAETHQVQAARVAAAQVEARIATVSGALETAIAGAGEPAASVRALARVEGVAAAFALDAAGAALAASDRRAAPYAAAALNAAGRDTAWKGAVAPAGQSARAVALRRSGGLTLLVVLNPATLLPETGTDGLVLRAADGAVLATRNAQGGEVQGEAELADGFVLVASAPAPDMTGALVPALLFFFLTLLAPVAAAAAALVLYTRTAERRAAAAEARLDKVERHFRLAVDGARAGVWSWRPDLDRMELSPRLQRMLGWTGEGPLTVGGFIALAVSEDQANLQTAFIAAKDAGALEASFRIERNGEILWIEARGVAVADGEQENAILMVGTALDVTPRREAELRTVALERRLKEAIEGFSGPFALYDQRKRLQHWNRSYQTLFQLPDGVLRPGASYDSIDVAAKALIRRERHDPADPQAREIEVASGAWVQLVERRTADGGLVCVGVDITALKLKEEELIQRQTELKGTVQKLELSEGRNRELARKAEEASRAKSSFLAKMSHELRTPLNAIMGFSEMIKAEVLGPLGVAKYKDYANDIYASGEMLLDLINDILDQAKIEAGKENLTPRPLDPLESIEQVTKLLRPRAESKGLQLLVDVEDLPEIMADHRTVKQILMNLISNAIKFTERGAVMVRGRPAANGVLLQVIDTGMGIPKEHLPRLAQPFAQVDEELSRRHGGTGLGLALAKTFAEAHGGRLTIESELDRGTVVSVFLPLTILAEAIAAE